MDVLQREFWDGQPIQRGTEFELSKRRGDRELRAVCSLQTHIFGFELVLKVQGLLARTQVCRSTDEILAVVEERRSAMLAAGWAQLP
jgi:hypothetical protein